MTTTAACIVNHKPSQIFTHPRESFLRQNHLLGALSDADLERLGGQLRQVSLPAGHVICESGCQQEFAYFPTTAMVSLLYVSSQGETTEVAVIGNDGLAGVCMLLGGATTPHRLIVQDAGMAFRIRAGALKFEFGRAGFLQQLLLRYVQALLLQAAQTAVCVRHHCVEEQLCRRLLFGLDRTDSNEIHATQESIANMLGVRREGITVAAGKLQRAGVIDYHRGLIRVLDRRRLEAQACECYRIVKRELERLMPAAMASQGHSMLART
jgi:CRP-like cAMP-binding protein